jgi:diaminohydroxyphosphoribosylaminopyrimidine deaminase/5-amino-6-(5-phosphoribosylamino)uracil reductase
VRDWTGRNPVRIVLDRFLRLDTKLHVFDRTQRTICYNVMKHEERDGLTLIRVDEENFIQNVLSDLHKQKIQSVIVEGGSQTTSSFIAANLWDEARIFISPQVFGKGIAAPKVKGEFIGEASIMRDTLRWIKPIR